SAAEIRTELLELTNQVHRLLRGDDADTCESLDMRLARLDVEEEELAVEDDVITGEEAHDALIGFDSWFLPEQITHAAVSAGAFGFGIPCSSSKPRARLRFCSACVAAPLSRLSSVA